MNSSCYRFKEFSFEKGILDECVDATYVVHLENNGRIPHIYQQLDLYQPTKKIWIVFNPGYKSGKKKLYLYNPSYDLIDSYLTIFKHAEERKYQNILVLEDDFIFNEKILENKNTESICHFLQHKNLKKERFLYSIGCLPWIQIPYEYYHRKILIRTGTHACIYSKELREKILKTEPSFIMDWDIYTNFYCSNYMFYEPLCYQLFPETDNKKNWFYIFILSDFFNFILRFLELDKKIEPGYSFFYWNSLTLFVFCLFLFLFFIYFFHSQTLQL